MSNRLRWSLESWLLATVLAITIGGAYAVAIGGRLWVGVTNGLVIGGGIAALEIFLLESPRGSFLRKGGLLPLIAGTTVTWAILVLGTLELARAAFGHPWGAAPSDHPHNNIYQDMALAFAVGFLVSFLARLQSLVGPRRLLSFLVGRYMRPVREQKVVMIADLSDSTALAEKLGDLKVQSLIGQFFFDVSGVITEHDGEIDQYIGDALVVTWPLDTGLRNATCLRCVRAMQDLIRRRGKTYIESFGAVPDFRAGLHCGPVVLAEVGDLRKAIALFGDTMNTTARLEQNCKPLGHQILLSGDLLERLTLPAGVTATDLGDIPLVGKELRANVYTVSFGTSR